MRDSIITTLYKNKGDCSDCNNYHNISLLWVSGKVFAYMALCHCQQLSERVYPESQCGFWSQCSMVDMIFSLRQLQEKCREQQQACFIAFINLTKAFDLIGRYGLFKILSLIGCHRLPSKASSSGVFPQQHARYCSNWCNMSEAFNIHSRVKQGCVLAPNPLWNFLLCAPQRCL